MLGGPAFGGEVIESRNPVADARFADPAALATPAIGGASSARVLRLHAVPTTLGSAGNRIRRGIVGVLREYAHDGAMTRMAAAGYPFLVVRREQFERVTTNRLARVRALRKVVPNRQGFYRAPQYDAGNSGPIVETT